MVEKLKSILFGLSDSSFPLSQVAFEDTVRHEFGLGASDPLPGIVKLVAKFKASYLAEGFQEDHGDVPKTRKFRSRVPCCIAHPGVCKHAHVDIFDALHLAARGVTSACIGAQFTCAHFLRSSLQKR